MSTTTKPDLSVSTTDHPNVLAMRKAFAAFAEGDLETVRQSMTDDAVWTNSGTSPIAGRHTGWPAIATMFGTLAERTGGTFSMNVLSTLADDLHAIAVYDATSTVDGTTATQRFVLVDDVAPDGRVSATHVFAYDQAASDAHLTGTG